MAQIDQNAPKDIVERNLALTSEIMRYLLDEPQIFNTLPDDIAMDYMMAAGGGAVLQVLASGLIFGLASRTRSR